MKKVLLIISMVTMFAAMTSCEADDETYNSFIGDWHLVRINANGEYRLPRPNADTCFNLHFFTNNSMIGESVQSTFSSVYNIRKKNKIEFSGFYYIPVSEDSTDNVVFMENILMADSYSMKEDTLKFMSDKKAYLLFVRR
jgi:hypothetical protein